MQDGQNRQFMLGCGLKLQPVRRLGCVNVELESSQNSSDDMPQRDGANAWKFVSRGKNLVIIQEMEDNDSSRNSGTDHDLE